MERGVVREKRYGTNDLRYIWGSIQSETILDHSSGLLHFQTDKHLVDERGYSEFGHVPKVDRWD